MSYKAPVKDMLFAMEHLARIDQVAQIPGFEEAGLDTAEAPCTGPALPLVGHGVCAVPEQRF